MVPQVDLLNFASLGNAGAVLVNDSILFVLPDDAGAADQLQGGLSADSAQSTSFVTGAAVGLCRRELCEDDARHMELAVIQERWDLRHLCKYHDSRASERSAFLSGEGLWGEASLVPPHAFERDAAILRMLFDQPEQEEAELLPFAEDGSDIGQLFFGDNGMPTATAGLDTDSLFNHPTSYSEFSDVFPSEPRGFPNLQSEALFSSPNQIATSVNLSNPSTHSVPPFESTSSHYLGTFSLSMSPFDRQRERRSGSLQSFANFLNSPTTPSSAGAGIARASDRSSSATSSVLAPLSANSVLNIPSLGDSPAADADSMLSGNGRSQSSSIHSIPIDGNDTQRAINFESSSADYHSSPGEGFLIPPTSQFAPPTPNFSVPSPLQDFVETFSMTMVNSTLNEEEEDREGE